MSKKRIIEPQAPTIENLVISDYVRLCTEGVKPGEAYRKVRRRLRTATTEKTHKS
ncbi:hypothetical protein G4O51_07010 [Candidatus Bathyarchaeota archaeon A05DMB-2]|nr:hypothetical protein [Candidatus Bathyarchaeota archaeon A05DMB-2]